MRTFSPSTRYALALRLRRLRQKPPLRDRDGANSGIDRLHAVHGKRAAVKGTGDLGAILQLADHAAHQKTFRADIAYVVVCQSDAPARPLAAGLLLGAAREHQDDVLAELLGIVALALLEAVPHGDDQHDRRDAPGDPRHRQKAAQLVAQQAGGDLCQQLTQVIHSSLR